MQIYVIESYSPGRGVEEHCGRARSTAEHGACVRYVRTIFLPGDETLLHVFEAASPEELREAARIAQLPYERIVEAVEGSAESHGLEATI